MAIQFLKVRVSIIASKQKSARLITERAIGQCLISNEKKKKVIIIIIYEHSAFRTFVSKKKKRKSIEYLNTLATSQSFSLIHEYLNN